MLGFLGSGQKGFGLIGLNENGFMVSRHAKAHSALLCV